MWLCVGAQVEDEIQTLSQVLAAKERRLADIKKKLGVTPLNEFKQNISRTWQEVTTSNAYVPHLLVCAHVRACDQILQVSMCENLRLPPLQLQTNLGDAVPGQPEGHNRLLQRRLGHHQEVRGRQVSPMQRKREKKRGG